MLLGPLLAGLVGAGLAYKFPAHSDWLRGVWAGLGLFLCVWASNTFPAFPPKVQSDWVAWVGLLPLGLLAGSAWRRALVQGALMLGVGFLLLPTWKAFPVLLATVAAAQLQPVRTDIGGRLAILLSGLGGALALYAGSSARLAFLSLGWGLSCALAGGGTALPLVLLALGGAIFASLPDTLFLALLVLAACDLRRPAGWVALLWIAGTAEFQPV